MLEIGSVFDGKYKILQEIGHGGMSTVYLALNERANKTWAIKEVRKNGNTDNVVVDQSLVAEIEMLKKLNHSHIVSIVDVVENDDSYIIIMDYVQGKDLLSVLQNSGPQNPDIVVEWAKQLCDVFGYLHRQNPPIIYRDMKPANVMLKPDGNIVVIDFGTARTNKGGSNQDTTWLGTRGYAAPEQFGGQGETDARTDIYTLGTTLYHLITGYSPADTNFVVYPVGQLVPELAGSGIEKIISKCCEPRREDRYQNCAELMEALLHVNDINDENIRENRRKWRLFLIPVTVAVMGMIGMAGFAAARSSTISQTYERSLAKAKLAENVYDAQEDYKSAMSIRPAEADAYMSMLNAIITDGKFDQNEKKTLDYCMGAKPITGGARNIEVLEARDPEGYAAFQYELGKDYFFYYEGGGYKYAAPVFDTIKDNSNLTPTELKVTNSLNLISSAYVSNTAGSSVGSAWLDEGTDWYKVWQQYEGLVGDASQAEANCGDATVAIAVYRELAKKITNEELNEFKNAGVTREMAENILSEAEIFMSQQSSDKMAVQKLIQDTNKAIQGAKNSVESVYHIIGTN